MPNRNYLRNDLAETISACGFCAVQLWRSSLKPLSILEANEGEEPHEIPGGFGNMFDDIALPEPSTEVALEFGQKQSSAGGFKVGVNLLGKLLGTIGGKIGLGANAQGVKEFLFEFKDTAVEGVSIDLLVRACSKARPNKDVLDRIVSERLQRFVVIRSLQAGSIVCTALNKKGGKLALDLDLGNLPATGDLKAELAVNGGINLKNPAGRALVFGIDYYRVKLTEEKVTIGSQVQDAPTMKMLTRVDLAAPQPVRYKIVKNLALGEQVKREPGFIDIGHK